jgi:iron complex outermembrane receptor protein
MACCFYSFREDKHPVRSLSWIGFLFFGSLLFLGTQLGAQVRQVSVVLEPEGVPGTFIPVWSDGSPLDTTDQRGTFELPPGKKTITLLPWQVGYDTMRLDVPQQGADWTISLQPNKVYQLPDAVVPAYPVTTPLSPGLPVQLSPHVLRRTGGISIAAALNSVPGVFMHTGALNTNRITLRGIGSRSPFATAKIRAYLDEIPLTNGDGETTIEDLDPELFERIDIWKGPGPARYGSGLGGLIHLRTRRPEAAAGSYAQAWGMAGSFGTYQLGQQVGWQSESGKTSGLLHNVYLHSDGYRENNTYDRFATTLLMRTQIADRHFFTFFARRQHLEALIPSALNADDFATAPQIAAANWKAVAGGEASDRLMVGTSWRVLLGDEWEGSLSALAESFSNDEVRPFNILAEDVMRQVVRGRLAWENQDRRWNWELGGEYFMEVYEELTFEADTASVSNLLSNWEEGRQYGFAFTQLVFRPWVNWSFSADLNVNQTSYEILDLFRPDSLDQSGDYAYDPIFLPRLSMTYQRGGLDRDLRVTLMGGRGFSAPTVAETLAPGGIPNPNIRPEEGWNAELLVRGRLKQFRFNLSGYSMWVNNLLVPQRVAEDQFVGVNAGRTLHQGIEGSWQISTGSGMSEWVILNLFGSSSFSRFRFVDFITDAGSFNGNRLPGVPELWAQAGARATFFLPDGSELILASQVAYTGDMALDDANTGFTDPFWLLDASGGWRKTWGDNRWVVDVRVGTNNAADARYSSMVAVNAQGFGGNLPRYFYPALPRHFFTRLSVRHAFGQKK